jgi:glycine betaine/proline transport system substrate-binding protein
MKTLFFKLIMLLMIVALVLAACGDDDKSSDKPTPTPEKPVIKLAAMPWESAEVNVTVAKLLLEQNLSYPVELVPTTTDEQWDKLADGTVHAQMEVWAQSSEIPATAEDGGELGAVGHGGWYIPFYMLDEHPDLRTWEGLQDPANVALFATEETGDKGRLLSGDPGWVHSQYAEAIVRNLELDLQIVYAGQEADELAIVEEAYENREPILFYFWTPHWVHGVYDLFEVQLPPYTAECYADPEAIACAYPSDVLRKAFWPGLKDYAPEAYQFLANFNYTTQDQIAIMAQVQLEEKTVEEAAQSWIDTNEDVWKAWLP